MRGYLGFFHYGHPCFIREEYEKAHEGEDELTRLEDALGMSFSDFNTAVTYAYTHARYLLYRLESDEVDRELLKGREPWVPYGGGYVHIVTGEFVEGPRPSRDSYPCWKSEEPVGRYFNPVSATQLTGALGLAAMVCAAIANIMGGRK